MPPRVSVFRLAFCAGLLAQAAQIVMFREMMAACRGTELFFGIVVAAGFFWAALGAVAASWMRKGLSNPLVVAAALFLCNGPLLMAQIVLARYRTPQWGGAADLTFLQSAGLAALATAPVAFSCGLQMTLALVSARRDQAARLYQLETWGAVAGALILTFILIRWLPPVAAGPALCAALLLLMCAAGGQRSLFMAGIALNAVCATAAFFFHLDERLHRQRWEARFPGFTLIEARDSRYGQLALLRQPDASQYSLYINGELAETISTTRATDPDKRNEALFAVAQCLHPQRALLVGGALGDLPRELLAAGVAYVDAAEPDPDLITMAQQIRLDSPTSHSQSIQIHKVDGRYFIKRAKEKYDLILLKLPPPLSGGINRYYTREFYEEARAALNEDGVLITAIPAAANYEGESVTMLSASILKTLTSVFPEVVVNPGESHVFVALSSGFSVPSSESSTSAGSPEIASGAGESSGGGITLDPAKLAGRLAERGLLLAGMDPMSKEGLKAFYEALFENMIPVSQVGRLRQSLDAQSAPINTDLRPIAYQYALRVWSQIVSARVNARDPGIGSGSNAAIKTITALTPREAWTAPLGLAALMALGWLILHPRRSLRGARTFHRFTLLITAALTGLITMTIEIALLLVFQSAYGFAYAQVGILVAVFMAGMAHGARMIQPGYFCEKKGFNQKSLLFLLAAMAAWGLMMTAAMPLLMSLKWYGILYVAFMILGGGAGFWNGALFPVMVQAYSSASAAADETSSPPPLPLDISNFLDAPSNTPDDASSHLAGWIYAADLAGAGFGSLAAGGIALPMLGMTHTLCIAATMLAIAILCIASCHRCEEIE
ncbi:MAG: hypothetical protein NTX50_23025 [Candidatus Sumerlaeota bacterium]|nr:hypothetical protein [Candidatus Sumerlaeota bacterium]